MFRKLIISLALLAFLTVAAFAGDSRAVLTRTPPAYPELAKRMNLEGTVTVRAVVGADGKVKAVSALTGNPILSQAAQAAVKNWVYAPGAEESIAVDVTFSK